MTRTKSRAPSQRQLRVGEALRHALAGILARGGLRDPALAGANVTVTEVRVSPDLRAATAFVLPFGAGGDAEALAQALNHASGFFRRALADAVDLRVAPTIHFEADRAFGAAGRIEAILRSPAVARDLAHDGGQHTGETAKEAGKEPHER